ncbi:uncharacterized protein LOC133315959 [Gastrolobium bilobum]|uniref:uncharacterized protein LOC133315959 n=1 Tax=Gastrolobium bilobum TaxID=150636 RepID=UPI002AB001AD|nr:uncharacterized protein LOC133315959 [Gastrolobium bilobum]
MASGGYRDSKEVRFEHLYVEGDAYIGTRALPTLVNSTMNAIELRYSDELRSSAKEGRIICYDVGDENGDVDDAKKGAFFTFKGSSLLSVQEFYGGKKDLAKIQSDVESFICAVMPGSSSRQIHPTSSIYGIEALAYQLGRPVEANPVFCRKGSFLSASGVCTFLVNFQIPTQFRKQQPALMLQSSQVIFICNLFLFKILRLRIICCIEM